MMQEFVQQIQETVQGFIDNVHTAVPGEVMSFDAAKCEAVVKLSGQFRKPDGSKIPYPPAARVPVVFPQVSAQQMTVAFPIKSGDGVLVLLAEQALEAWRAGGESNLDLKHDLTNAIAIPGLWRTPNAVMQEAVSLDAIVLDNQGTKVRVMNGLVEIVGDVHITGDTTIDGELYVQGIAFTPHVHTGVLPGGGESGPPRR